MVLASYYVLEHISQALEEDRGKVKDIFEKFSHRYSQDIRLNKIYHKFKDKEKIGEVKKSLEELKSARKLGGNGSVGRSYAWYLWYKSRR